MSDNNFLSPEEIDILLNSESEPDTNRTEKLEEQKSRFRAETITHLKDDFLQTVLRKSSLTDIALSVRDLPEPEIDKIRNNLSRRMRREFNEELELSRNKPENEAHAALGRVRDLMIELQSLGEIL